MKDYSCEQNSVLRSISTPKRIFLSQKIQMLITFILVGGFEKFKVLQKAYLEHIKNIALILGRGVKLGSVGLP